MVERRCEGVFCGIDIGTQGVRAVLSDVDGTIRGTGSAPLAPGLRTVGRHEQDPDAWWSALVHAMRAVRADIEVRGGSASALLDVDAVALDATSGTVLVEDGDGRAVGPALMYDDARAAECAARAQHVGDALWNELGYHMQPTWALPKVMWLLEHAELPAGARVVHQADHVVRRLVGQAVATDTSNALKTGVDLRDASWPRALHDELGLPSGLLPDVVFPGAVLGRLSDEAARATSLRRGTVVRAGMTDGCAAQIAAGALAQGSWSSALGTTLVIKGSTTELLRDPSGAVYCHRHPDGGWLPGGASSTGAGALGAALPGADGDRLSRLTELARLQPLDDAVVYPLVGTGERFPFLAPTAHGFGQTGDHSASDDGEAASLAAVCRGVAYVERLAYDVLSLLGADTTGSVALTGGATRNSWWNQLRTDVLGRETVRPASAEAAFGMAVLAAAEPGRLTETASAMVRIEQRLTPDAERTAELRVGYLRLVEQLAHRGWLDDDVAHAITGLKATSR